MKKIGKKALATSFILLTLFSFSSCITDKEAQQKFGDDAEYFVGLQLLSEGNEKAARSKLKKCAKKGTYYCARKSAEELCSSFWAINFTVKHNPGLELKEIVVEEG